MKINFITLASLVLLLSALYCCKKHDSSKLLTMPTPQSYVLKMGSFRMWHGIQNDNCQGCPVAIDTTYSISDTFTINVLDTARIIVPFTVYTAYDSFYYVSADTDRKFITLSAGVTSSYYNGNIIYYYLIDSIVYTTMLTNPGETLITNLHTP